MKKDEDLKNGNFELGCDALGSCDSDVSEVVGTPLDKGNLTGQDDLDRIDAKVDSVVHWIRQFYDRFRYLDEEVAAIRELVLVNKDNIDGLMNSSSGSDISNGVFVDNQRLELEIGILVQKIDENRVHFEGCFNNGLHNAQMNEMSRMNESVGSGVEESKEILDEVGSMFLKIRKIKDEIDGVSPSVKKKEARAVRSREDFDKWKRGAELGTLREDEDLRSKDVGEKRKKKYKKYKKLVEDEPKREIVISHPVGSREWLKEVKKNSK